MYLGRDGGRPADLRRDARREVEAHPNVTFISGRAGEVTGSAGNFTAAVGDQKVQAACVLIATGVVDQLPEIPGLAERWGQQVGHCAYCDGFEALGRTVAVVALDPMDAILARYLADRFSDRVVLHAGKIQDATDALALARDGGVEVTDLMVTGFSSEDPVELALSDGSTSTAEAVFVRPPTVLGSDLGEQLSCELTDDGLVAVSATQQTSVDGVFAAGDGARLRDAPRQCSSCSPGPLLGSTPRCGSSSSCSAAPWPGSSAPWGRPGGEPGTAPRPGPPLPHLPEPPCWSLLMWALDSGND